MKVVVIGGGVIGLWCARDLAATGAEVTVIDGCGESAASTRASAGWVVPVLSTPLSGPGVVTRSVGQLVRGTAAFSVSPTPSPELARWLWSFVRSGREQAFREALRATLDLAGACVEQYAALRDSGPPFEMHRDGLVMVARTEEGVADAETLAENAARAGYDGKCDTLDRERLLDLEPALTPDVAGGVFAHDELHVRPEQLTAALRDGVREKGVRLHLGEHARAIVPATGGRWTVVTSTGTFRADKVIVAAGYWSKALLSTLGVRVPLQPAAGFSITATGPEPPSLPLKLIESNVAVTPFDEGVRLAGRFALGRPPRQVSSRQVARVIAAAAPYLRSWKAVDVSARHVGLRPVTPDSLPLVGQLPGHRGVFAATGHGMLGLTLAPGTAIEIAHQIATDSPSDVGAAFAVDRFPGVA